MLVFGSSPKRFGDGVVGMSLFQPAELTLTGGVIEGSARAGIANFGSNVRLASTRLGCNSIAINGELIDGMDFVFDDRGENTCECGGESAPCQVVSSMLAPPDPID